MQLFFYLLHLVKPLIQATSGHELLVVSLLNNPAFIQYENKVGAFYRRKPMRNHKYGAAVDKPIQCFLDNAFRFSVQLRCCFIQE